MSSTSPANITSLSTPYNSEPLKDYEIGVISGFIIIVVCAIITAAVIAYCYIRKRKTARVAPMDVEANGNYNKVNSQMDRKEAQSNGRAVESTPQSLSQNAIPPAEVKSHSEGGQQQAAFELRSELSAEPRETLRSSGSSVSLTADTRPLLPFPVTTAPVVEWKPWSGYESLPPRAKIPPVKVAIPPKNPVSASSQPVSSLPHPFGSQEDGLQETLFSPSVTESIQSIEPQSVHARQSHESEVPSNGQSDEALLVNDNKAQEITTRVDNPAYEKNATETQDLPEVANDLSPPKLIHPSCDEQNVDQMNGETAAVNTDVWEVLDGANGTNAGENKSVYELESTVQSPMNTHTESDIQSSNILVKEETTTQAIVDSNEVADHQTTPDAEPDISQPVLERHSTREQLDKLYEITEPLPLEMCVSTQLGLMQEVEANAIVEGFGDPVEHKDETASAENDTLKPTAVVDQTEVKTTVSIVLTEKEWTEQVSRGKQLEEEVFPSGSDEAQAVTAHLETNEARPHEAKQDPDHLETLNNHQETLTDQQEAQSDHQEMLHLNHLHDETAEKEKEAAEQPADNNQNPSELSSETKTVGSAERPERSDEQENNDPVALAVNNEDDTVSTEELLTRASEEAVSSSEASMVTETPEGGAEEERAGGEEANASSINAKDGKTEEAAVTDEAKADAEEPFVASTVATEVAEAVTIGVGTFTPDGKILLTGTPQASIDEGAAAALNNDKVMKHPEEATAGTDEPAMGVAEAANVSIEVASSKSTALETVETKETEHSVQDDAAEAPATSN